MGSGGSCGSASSKFRKVARKLVLLPCGFYSSSSSSSSSSGNADSAAVSPASTASIVNSHMVLSNKGNFSEIMDGTNSPASIPSKVW
ncbi:hypothetical protein V2J09_009177 [Rumex salicifolius]